MGFQLKAWLSAQLARRNRRGRGQYGHQNVSQGVSGYMTPKNVVTRRLDEIEEDPYSGRREDDPYATVDNDTEG